MLIIGLILLLINEDVICVVYMNCIKMLEKWLFKF